MPKNNINHLLDQQYSNKEAMAHDDENNFHTIVFAFLL
jgi:hypothetical protein